MTNNKKMSATQLTFLTAMNMMGSGIILLPTKLAQVGTISIISWVITALGSASLAFVFAKCSAYSKYPNLGGYAENAFGKAGNFLTNYAYCLGQLVANIAVAVTCVGYFDSLFDIKFSPIGACLLAVAILWICSVANFRGASFTGRLSGFAIWLVVIPVFGLSIIGWYWFDPKMYVSAWNPSHTPFFSAINASIAMTLWSFLGLESACANSDAVENPEKNVPIAVITATVGVAIIYITSTNVIAGIIPNAELLKSNAPYGLVYAFLLGEKVGKIAMFMLVLACVACTLGWQFTIAKVFQSSSDAGFFPSIFGKLNRFGAPVKGMILITAIQTAVCLLTINPVFFKQFNSLVDLAVVLSIIPYILSMSALPVILARAKVNISETRRYIIIAICGSLFSFYALFSTGMNEVFYGSIVIFAGWVCWGLIAPKFLIGSGNSLDPMNSSALGNNEERTRP